VKGSASGRGANRCAAVGARVAEPRLAMTAYRRMGASRRDGNILSDFAADRHRRDEKVAAIFEAPVGDCRGLGWQPHTIEVIDVDLAALEYQRLTSLVECGELKNSAQSERGAGKTLLHFNMRNRNPG